MRITRLFPAIVFVALSSITFTTIARNKYEPWVEKMECGSAQIQLESICKKSDDDMTLNKCRSQKIIFYQRTTTKKIQLPDLTATNKKTIASSGGRISDLFVTRWACVNAGQAHVIVLYYSTGGGSAPYSESQAVYSESGEILEDDQDPRNRKEMLETPRKMIPVRSIMPE